jgi:F-type H+-transporting ATPase subunit gamma
MPSLKAIRTRIASVKSTQKITRAMKLVAAAKLRRAQDATVGARPYADALLEVIGEVALRAGAEDHPLLQQRPPERLTLIPITTDRGLAGGLNTNVFRAVQRFTSERPETRELALEVVGRKGRDYFRRRKLAMQHELPAATSETADPLSRELAKIVVTSFGTVTDEGVEENPPRTDAVYLVYTEFKSALAQRVVVEPLLPVTAAALAPPLGAAAGAIDFLYEPSKSGLLNALLPLYVQSQIYRALLESVASEFGARMTAMDSATNNAKEMIATYTLQYNRARQAAITKELMEIVGGAEALKG